MLSERRIRHLLEVAHGAREGSLGERLAHLSRHMRLAVPSGTSMATVVGPDDAEYVHTTLEPEFMDAYVERYYLLDTALTFLLERPGQVRRSSAFYSDQSFGRDEYTAYLLTGRARFIVATTLELPSGGTLVWSLQRPEGHEDYDESDLQAFRLVLPDLQRAIFGGILAERLRCPRSPEFSGGLAPLVQLTTLGEVVDMDARARRWLEEADVSLEVFADLLAAGARVAHARGEATRALPSRAGWLRLTFYRHPDYTARVVLLLERFATQEDVFVALAGEGLTPTETQVAALAVRGLTNSQIARELGRSRETVKGHLASVYRKAGIRSRSALSALCRGRA